MCENSVIKLKKRDKTKQIYPIEGKTNGTYLCDVSL